MKNKKSSLISPSNPLALNMGRVTKRNISGHTYYYFEWEEGGKKRSKTISKEEYDSLKEQIARRRELSKGARIASLETKEKGPTSYNCNVIVGEALKVLASSVRGLRKRDCFEKIEEYINSDQSGKILILYGLRRTGKTTLIRQSILEMGDEDFSRSAFIQIGKGDSLKKLNEDLKALYDGGYRYIYIDEVTYLEDFIEGAELFSDIYASMGMKIILSGTDSLGFYLSKGEHLYDRCYLIHTTFIPYREFERVLGKKGIDEYIVYGGTMAMEGTPYNENSSILAPYEEYLDTAVAENIQHSLRYYQDGGHFRDLKRLYDEGELTSAINWVVEDMNHDFTKSALEHDFVSHDFGLSARNLRKDRFNPDDTLDKVDMEKMLSSFRKLLSIVNPSDRKVPLEDYHLSQIKEYLLLLDFVKEVDVFSLPSSSKSRKKEIVTQPAIRFNQVKKLVDVILLDPVFDERPQREIEALKERILDEVKGRMMEDIVLLESVLSSKGESVFKLEFPSGEFDMVKVYDGGRWCEVFEIKHSDKTSPGQLSHLLDEEKCRLTENKYGPIKRKTLIYRGESRQEGDITYLNVEEYLNSLS